MSLRFRFLFLCLINGLTLRRTSRILLSAEMKNPIVLSFEFNKEAETNEISNFRLKAPEQMEFGKLFYFFINDYNEGNPESPIAIQDRNRELYDWVFYSKPNLFGTRKHYDFNKTIQSNGLKENDVVICQRA